MRIPKKYGSEERWRRRFAKKQNGFWFFLRLPFYARDFLIQMLVGIAIALFVLLIALIDRSIRRFLEANVLFILGVGFAFGGYPELGASTAGFGFIAILHYIRIWRRQEPLQEKNT